MSHHNMSSPVPNQTDEAAWSELHGCKKRTCMYMPASVHAYVCSECSICEKGDASSREASGGGARSPNHTHLRPHGRRCGLRLGIVEGLDIMHGLDVLAHGCGCGRNLLLPGF